MTDHDAIEVLVCPHYAPFSFLDAKGELCGVAVSIMNELGKILGTRIHYNLLEWGQDVQAQMATGQYDMLIGPPSNSEFAIDNSLIVSKYMETNLTMFVNRASQDKPQSECVPALSKEFPIADTYCGGRYLLGVVSADCPCGGIFCLRSYQSRTQQEAAAGLCGQKRVPLPHEPL